MSSVLDSSAVIALLDQEPGREKVFAVLPEAVISSVNLAEVLRVLVRRGATLRDARRAFARINIPVAAFGEDDAEEAIKVAAIAPELSLGDCACLALARARGATEVLTADRAWSKYNFAVPVTAIR